MNGCGVMGDGQICMALDIETPDPQVGKTVGEKEGENMEDQNRRKSCALKDGDARPHTTEFEASSKSALTPASQHTPASPLIFGDVPLYGDGGAPVVQLEEEYQTRLCC